MSGFVRARRVCVVCVNGGAGGKKKGFGEWWRVSFWAQQSAALVMRTHAAAKHDVSLPSPEP